LLVLLDLVLLDLVDAHFSVGADDVSREQTLLVLLGPARRRLLMVFHHRLDTLPRVEEGQWVLEVARHVILLIGISLVS